MFDGLFSDLPLSWILALNARQTVACWWYRNGRCLSTSLRLGHCTAMSAASPCSMANRCAALLHDVSLCLPAASNFRWNAARTLIHRPSFQPVSAEPCFSAVSATSASLISISKHVAYRSHRVASTYFRATCISLLNSRSFRVCCLTAVLQPLANIIQREAENCIAGPNNFSILLPDVSTT
jgi:hypothetical protein